MPTIAWLVVFLPGIFGSVSAQFEKLAALAATQSLGLSNGVPVGNTLDGRTNGGGADNLPSSNNLQRQPTGSFQSFFGSPTTSSSASLFASSMPMAGLSGINGGGGGGATMLTKGLDLETFTKNAAIHTNQEHALVEHLSNMAPTKRHQLARDMGNMSSANELVHNLMRELAASPTGSAAFPSLSFGASPSSMNLGNLLLSDEGQRLGGMGLHAPLTPVQQQQLIMANQFMAEQLRRQNLQLAALARGGSFGQQGRFGQQGFGSPNQAQQFGAGGFGIPSQLGNLGMTDQLLRNQLLQQQQQASMMSSGFVPQPPSPFLPSTTQSGSLMGNNVDSALLTRPQTNSMLSDAAPLFPAVMQQSNSQLSPRPPSSIGSIGQRASPPNNKGPLILDGSASDSVMEGAERPSGAFLLRSLDKLGSTTGSGREAFIDNVENGFGQRVPHAQQMKDSTLPLDFPSMEIPIPPLAPLHVARREQTSDQMKLEVQGSNKKNRDVGTTGTKAIPPPKHSSASPDGKENTQESPAH